MKRHEVKVERELNGNRFFIRPFGAFKAANMSGEIFSLLSPILPGIVSAVEGAGIGDDEVNIFDMDIGRAVPHLSSALSGISGDKVEALAKKLLIQYKNISVELEGEKVATLLTEDVADEVFCGDPQDMFMLMLDVIKANYAGFFKSLGDRFGGVLKAFKDKVLPGSEGTED